MGPRLRAYLDSSAVIDLIDSESVRHAQAQASLLTLDRNWCTSDLVRLECLVRPLRVKNLKAEVTVRNFLATMEDLEIASESYDEAARLRAEYGLRTPDALHIATAMAHGCQEFWTNDLSFARLSDRIAICHFL